MSSIPPKIPAILIQAINILFSRSKSECESSGAKDKLATCATFPNIAIGIDPFGIS